MLSLKTKAISKIIAIDKELSERQDEDLPELYIERQKWEDILYELDN